MLAYCQKIAEGPPMEMSEYDEIRATVRLPNLDIGILHRRPWEGNEEQIVVMLRAVASFEAVGRWLEASNPLLVWSRMMQAAWSHLSQGGCGRQKSQSGASRSEEDSSRTASPCPPLRLKPAQDP